MRCAETGATAFGCDAQDEAQVARLFESVDQRFRSPDVVIYNASAAPAVLSRRSIRGTSAAR
jgi:NAD(P)-dependent dehydrogenase (short-subunit alcohol dehydrogenase family)